MSDIKLFKLISGEELLATVRMRGASIEIEDAVTLVYQQVGDGKMSVGFAPYMPYADDKVILLNPSAIASEASPKEQILGEYNRVFSKIVIAPANSI